MALVASSEAPLVLLDGEFRVIAASNSFHRIFEVAPDVVGRTLVDVGEREWNVPQLVSLLQATASGAATIAAYEMDLIRKDYTVSVGNAKPGTRVSIIRADPNDAVGPTRGKEAKTEATPEAAMAGEAAHVETSTS